MDVSVVIPTLNGRAALVECLDALATHAPDAEVIVVNGPSTDGTSGMVHDRDDVDVLVEVADRNVNVARNAGLTEAEGDVIALLDQGHRIDPSWRGAIEPAIGSGADAVTGPTYRPVLGGVTSEDEESRTIAGREVTYFSGGNVALTREAIRDLDGFDEYLETGGARDAAHRLAARGRSVRWTPGMSVRGRLETDGGGRDAGANGDPRLAAEGDEPRRLRFKYRSLAYRLVKNYSLRPTVVFRTGRHAAADAFAAAHEVVRGEDDPTEWIADGRDVAVGTAVGTKDGLLARLRDRTATRNPRGLSTRHDRAVERYDWR